jgi:ribonuclease HI
MHILQWNAQSVREHGDELNKAVIDQINKPDIICIQESWLKKHHKFGICGYEIVRKDRDPRLGKSKCGGVVTCIQKGIAYRMVESVDLDIEAIVVEVFRRDSSSVFVVNIYNPCLDMKKEDLDSLFSGIEGRSIICGDFNAHNTLWGSSKNDKNGKLTEDMLDDYDLVCLNDGSGTRLDKHTGRLSCIDLTLVSGNFALNCSWMVKDDNWGSDHFPIVIGTQVSVMCNERKTVPRWSLKRANWERFHSECVLRITPPVSDDLTDDIYDTFISQLTEAVDESIPKTKLPSGSKSPVPWWTDNCSRVIREKKTALNRLKRSALPEDYIVYKKKRAEARRMIKEAKKNSWEEYCGSITSKTSTREVWNKVKSISKNKSFRSIPTLIDQNKKCGVSNQDKAEILVESFARVSSNANYDPDFHDVKDQRENELIIGDDRIEMPINDEFTLNELNCALDTAKCTTPGADGIGAGILKQLPTIIRRIFLTIINIIWIRGECPSVWKQAILTPILKPSKDPSNPLSYRPIALTSVVCKTMERMITNRLQWYLEQKNYINPAQSGFRAGRKTTDHLVHLESAINTGRANRESTLAVFLDLEKAYDMVWKKGVIIKMQTMGLCGRIVRWVDDFLANRYIRVRVNGYLSGFKYVENGVPQGSVISPSLFNIAVSDLPNKVQKSKITQFADDICIWKSNRNITFLIKQVQSDLFNINNWCNQWGFKLSAKKSVGILFTKKIKIPDVKLEIAGNDICIKKSAKFLGLTLDSSLTWNDHINDIIDRCKPRLNLLRCISGSKWGASSSSLLNIYKALIKPLLVYGCEAFNSASDSVKNKLKKVQYQALRICTGAICRTSLSKLQVECGDPPLQLSWDFLSNIFSRIIVNSGSHPNNYLFDDNWQCHYFHDKWTDKHHTPFNIRVKHDARKMFYKPCLSFPYWLLPELHVHFTIHPLVKEVEDIFEKREIAIKNIYGKWKMAFHIYTDGSVDISRRKVGCGYYVPEFNCEGAFRLADNISIFNAELMAIYLALLWVADVEPSNVCIFSDSMSALQALTHLVSDNAIVLDIKHLMLSVQSQGICVQFDWVPAHCNIAGNERADSIAKRAANKVLIDVDLNPSINEVKREEKLGLLGIWQQDWDKARDEIVLKQIKPNVNFRMVSWDINRADEVVFRRLRLGLGKSLSSFQELINKHPDGLCNICLVKDTVKHFLLECKKFDAQRADLKEKVSEKTLLNFDIKAVLGGADAPINEVVSYVRQCGIEI